MRMPCKHWLSSWIRSMLNIEQLQNSQALFGVWRACGIDEYGFTRFECSIFRSFDRGLESCWFAVAFLGQRHTIQRSMLAACCALLDRIKTKLLQKVQFSSDTTAFKHIARDYYAKNEKRSVFPGTLLIRNNCHSKLHGVLFRRIGSFIMNRCLLTNEQLAIGVVMAADKGVMKIAATDNVKLFPKRWLANYPNDVNNVIPPTHTVAGRANPWSKLFWHVVFVMWYAQQSFSNKYPPCSRRMKNSL